MKQQTAMQKLLTNLKSIGISIPQGVEMVYLKIEKMQIKTAFESGWNWNFNAEQYYNENFNAGTGETEH